MADTVIDVDFTILNEQKNEVNRAPLFRGQNVRSFFDLIGLCLEGFWNSAT